MEQLFSVEVFVKTILLYDSVQPVPTRNDIDVNVIFGKVLNLVISPENIIDQKPPQQLTDMEEVEVEKVSVKSEKSQKSEMPKKAHIQIDEDKGTLLVNCGKSYLFHANTKELQEQFADCEFSIEVTRREDSKHIGLTNFDFIEDFNNYIENSGSNETNSESLVIDKSLRIKDMATDEKVGIIEILIRFTAFGDNVQTTFEIIDTNRDNPYEPSNRFIFKNVRCPTSFKIETFNAEQLQEVGMPVPGAPILGAADIEVAQLKPLFITSFKSRQSVMVPYFKDQMEKNTINQVFIKTGGPTNKIGRPINEITASTINASLCGNKCCPVALKFKELGLGPLASKNVGLGAMSGKVKANTTYGLSQGYGVMDNYGPFGLLKRRQSKCSCEVEDLSKVVNCGCLKSDSVVNYKADHTDKCMPGSCPFNGMMPKDDRVVKTPDAESQDGCGCLGASVLLKDSDACAVASCPFRVRKEPKPRKINCGCLGKGSFNSHSKGSFRSFNGSDAGNCCCSSPKKSKKEGCGCGLTNFPRSRAGADDFCGGQSCKLSKVEPATCNPICPGGGLQKPQKCGSRKCPMSDTDSIMKPEMPFTMFQPNRDHYALASRLETPPAARRSQRASFVPDFDLTPSPRSCFPPPSCPPPRPSCPPAPVCPPPRPCCPPPRPSCPPPRPSCPPAPVCPPPRPACSPRLTFPPPCCPPECPPQPRCPPRASCPQGPSCPFCPPSPVCPPRPNCPPRSCPFCPPMCPPKPICPPRPNCPPRPSCPPAQTNYPPRESYGTVSSRRSFGSSNFQSQCKTCSCLDDDREDASSLDKCVFDNCPFSVKEEDFTCCGGQPCPFVSDVLNQDTNQEYMGNGDPFYRQTAVTLENCGSPCCPLANFLELEKKFDELTRNDTCGKPDCPFAAVLEKDPDCSCLEARASLMSWCRRNRMSEAKPETIEEQPEPEKVQKKKKPCKRNACKKMKMLTCEECGGVSASGATCSNPLGNVPFNDDWSDDATDASSMASKDERRSTKREAEGAPLPIMDEKKPLPIQKIKHSEKHPRHRSRFVYRDGEYYPGIRVGHRTCAASGKNVPSNMGWLWNCEPASGMRRRRGWKPGVIGKTINERIINHRRELGIPDPPELKMLVSKKKFRQSKFPCDDESDEEVEPKPTLHIRKKDGVYFITMNPLKDPKSLAENENPYMDCTPMQFTITKNKPEVPAVTDAPAIREHGEDREGSPISSKSSLYGNSYKDCLCSEDEELVESSSESELDIEFTTPAGLIFPERFKRKPNVIHTETQFNEADLTDPDCVYLSPTNKQRKKKVRLRR